MEQACLHCGLPVPRHRLKGSREDLSAGNHFCCSGCRLVYQMIHAGEDGSSKSDRQPGSLLLLRLGLGIFLAMNLMAFNWLFYSGHIFGFDLSGEDGQMLAGLFAWLMLFLSTVVLVLLGVPLVLSQWQLVRTNGFLAGCNTHLLILLGVSSAYGLSVWQTLSGEAYEGGRLYFDTAAITLILVTLGAYLDSRARQKAIDETREVMQTLPDEAIILDERGERRECASSEIQIDDRVVIAAGSTIPADGRIVEGRGYINEAHLTGEAKPRSVSCGDWVHAGSQSEDGELIIQAERVGESRLSAQISKLLAQLQRERSPMQGLADQVARYFLPGVMLLATAVFSYWTLVSGFRAGLLNSLSVLLISCPCALGLASPLATFKALKEVASSGAIFRSPLILESLSRITTIYFDKTGTLTRRELKLLRIEMAEDTDLDWQAVLALAAEMESGTNHVIASAIKQATNSHTGNSSEPCLNEKTQTVPGLGLISGQWRLGSERFVVESGLRLSGDVNWQVQQLSDDQAADSESELIIYLFDDNKLHARLRLGEAVRAEARGVLHSFRSRGIAPVIVSGDRPENVANVARQLGLGPASQHAGFLPQDKLALVQKREGSDTDVDRIALVGDGVNDAPALAAADVGIVMSHAPDLSQQAGDLYLIRNDLSLIPQAYLIARRALTRIRLNLVWAFGYNIIGLSLAACGMLSPLFAGVAMVMSSLMIILTSSANYLDKKETPQGRMPMGANPASDISAGGTHSGGSNSGGVRYA